MISQLNAEKIKYTYKEQLPPTLTILTNPKTGLIQYSLYGFMTFTNDADALTFKNTIFPLIDSKDVVYALVYYLGNTHHYSNPLPDVILEKIEYGDQNAVIGSSP